MEPETVALLGGLLFLLIAIVGGGFTLKELIMPGVPGWARVAALFVGVTLVVPYFVNSLEEAGDRSEVASTPSPSGAQPTPGVAPSHGSGATIFEDPEPHRTQDGIEVSGLMATGERHDVSVGDRITIRFSLRNTASQAATLDYAFIAARNPRDDNLDFGEDAQGAVLRPGDTVSVGSSIIVDAAGTWEFWPCYYLRAAGGESECPNQWRRFEIAVQ